MIPVIIDQLKLNRISKHEHRALQRVYGSLWHLMVEESNRLSSNAEMNPVLKSLLHAQENRLKTALSIQYANDVSENTVAKIVKKYQIKGDDKIAVQLAAQNSWSLSPAQRILTAAALLIYENSRSDKNPRLAMRFQRNRRSHKKSQSGADLPEAVKGVSTTISPSETLFKSLKSNDMETDNTNLKRQKRSSILESSLGIDDIQMKLLENLLANNDMEYNDDDYVASESDYADEVDDKDLADDYALDVTDTNIDEDEQFLRNYYGKKNLDNNDYGSISELLQLAVKHNKRKQINKGYLKIGKDQLEKLLNDDYSYDDY